MTDTRKWKTIRTAPKDGSRVLLWDGKNVYLGLWDSNFGISEVYDQEKDEYTNRPAWTDHTVKSWGYEETNEIENPTHWMSLPDPPTAPTPPEGRMPPLAHEQNDSVDNGRVDSK